MSNIERALRRAQQRPPAPPAQADPAPAHPVAAPPATEPEIAGVWKLDPRIVAYHQRYTASAEAFRKLAAKLLAFRRQQDLACLMIGITSASHTEGKSLTAANLAVVLAQDFRVPTLLVDGDIRRPTFASYLGLNLTTGLADLVDGAPLDHAVVGTPLADLHILGSGTTENPTEVFESGRLSAALAQLRGVASVVICDCPPVLPVADTQLLAPNLDGTLLVVRANQTQATDIRRMIEALDDASLLGFVLNYADRTSPTYYHADVYYGPADGAH